MSTINDILQNGGTTTPPSPPSSETLVQQNAEQTQGAPAQPSHENGGTGDKSGSPALSQQSGESIPAVSPAIQAKAVVQTPAALANPQQPQASSVQSQSTVQQQQSMTYEQMIQQTSTYKPPTPEELEALKKKEKREAIFSAIGEGISSLANLYFASQSGVNMYDPRKGIGAAHIEKWDKLRKENEKNSEQYMKLTMQARQADDAKARDERNWQNTLAQQKEAAERWKQQFEHQQERERKADERYDAEQAYKKDRDQKADEMRDKQFNESVRQFNVSSAQSAQRIKNESVRLSREMKKDVVTFTLGTGKGNIEIPKDALNAANVAHVFSMLPDDVRAQVKGDAIIGKDITGESMVVGYKEPSTEAMLIAIGTNIEGNSNVQDALRELGGKKPAGKKANPMGGGDKKPNPMQ